MRAVSLDDLFRTVKLYSRIIVLGPQRSGTNFMADVLAEATDYPLFSERSFGETSCSLDPKVTENKTLHEFTESEKKYVLQAPVLTCLCHTLYIPDAILCYMDRPAEEIEASRVKSDWPGTKRELDKYSKYHPDLYEEMRGEPLGDLQQYIFDNVQKEKLKMPCIEVPFSVLSKHPRWCPPELRASFKIGQTRPEQS